MFYSANEVLVNLTEKTKVFAQKCAQQIRINAHQNGQSANAHKTHNKQQQQHQPATLNGDSHRADHIKAISKSQADIRRCDADKSAYQSMFDAIAPRKSTANAARSNKNTNLFHTLTGSLRLRRRKSLSDTEQLSKTCGRKRNKSNAISLGYATTRWYVKVSISGEWNRFHEEKYHLTLSSIFVCSKGQAWVGMEGFCLWCIRAGTISHNGNNDNRNRGNDFYRVNSHINQEQ